MLSFLSYSNGTWAGFVIFILLVLSIDLGIFSRQGHAVSYREATTWSVVWITLAMIFAGGVFYFWGQTKGLEFLTGYIIELSLSVDNLFVFLLIFSYFQVPPKYQHRVLFWGVLGALIMRITMIFIGANLIVSFHWMLYIFGAFLVFTGLRMFRQGDDEIYPEQNPVVRLVTRFVPIMRSFEDDKFFTRREGRNLGTLLLLVLVIVEVTDLVFAVDSIPAIFSVTRDTYIIYTSNVFAILGLRSLYFLLSGVVAKFYYLKTGLAIVLTFIGLKMLTDHWLSTWMNKEAMIATSLGVVALVLLSSVAASMLWPKQIFEEQSSTFVNEAHMGLRGFRKEHDESKFERD